MFVPGHPRKTDDGIVQVNSYWRTVTPSSPLRKDEATAIRRKAKEILGPDLKAGMKSPRVKMERRQAEIAAVNANSGTFDPLTHRGPPSSPPLDASGAREASNEHLVEVVVAKMGVSG